MPLGFGVGLLWGIAFELAVADAILKIVMTIA